VEVVDVEVGAVILLSVIVKFNYFAFFIFYF
jgi:hypothetical protein